MSHSSKPGDSLDLRVFMVFGMAGGIATDSGTVHSDALIAALVEGRLCRTDQDCTPGDEGTSNRSAWHHRQIALH